MIWGYHYFRKPPFIWGVKFSLGSEYLFAQEAGTSLNCRRALLQSRLKITAWQGKSSSARVGLLCRKTWRVGIGAFYKPTAGVSMCLFSMLFFGGGVGSQLDKWIFPSQCFWGKMGGMYLAEWFFYWYRPMFYLFLLALRNAPQNLVSFKQTKKSRLNSSAWMMAVLFQPTARCEKDTEVEENPSEMGLQVHDLWSHTSLTPYLKKKRINQNWTQITRERTEKFKPSFTLFSGRKKLEEVQQQSISFETARKWNASLGFKQLIREMISHESLPSSKFHLVYIFQRQPLMPDVWKILETNLKSHVSSHWVSLSESVNHTLPKNNSKFAPWK